LWEEEALGGTGRWGWSGRWERKWMRPRKEPRRKKAAKRGSGRRVKKRNGCGRLPLPGWWCLGEEEAEELWRSGEEGGEEAAKGCWCRSRCCDLAGECGRRIDAIDSLPPPPPKSVLPRMKGVLASGCRDGRTGWRG
jgi:hypothetical protein